MVQKQPIKMLCIGEPLKEYVATCQPDGQLTDERLIGFAGDVAPNMASYAKMAAREFDVPCTIDVLTALGAQGDAPSDGAIKDLQDRGLGIHLYTKRFANKSMGTVTNLKTPDGTQAAEKVRLDRKDSAFRDLLNDATDDDLRRMAKDYTHIVVSGIPLACVRERAKLVRLLQYAKENVPPAKVIVSTNLRPSNWQMPDNEHVDGIKPADPAWKEKARRWLDEIIPMADTLVANFTDEKNLRGSTEPTQTAKNLRRLNPKAEIVLTDDDKPIQLMYHDGKRDVATSMHIHRAEKVVDTVGAGDSLAATYVFAREAGYSPVQAARFGTYVASQVVGFDGALPKVGELLSFTLPGVRASEITAHPTRP